MTKREPFVKGCGKATGNWDYIVCGEDLYGETYRCVNCLKSAQDKAVREAVEEFRERAAGVCDDSVMWVPRGNVSECTKTPHELAADIRALSVGGEAE